MARTVGGEEDLAGLRRAHGSLRRNTGSLRDGRGSSAADAGAQAAPRRGRGAHHRQVARLVTAETMRKTR